MLFPPYTPLLTAWRLFSSHLEILPSILKLHTSNARLIRILRVSQKLVKVLTGVSVRFSRRSVYSFTQDTVQRIWCPWSENSITCSAAQRTVNSPSSGASMHTSKSSMHFYIAYSSSEQQVLCVCRYFVLILNYLRINEVLWPITSWNRKLNRGWI